MRFVGPQRLVADETEVPAVHCEGEWLLLADAREVPHPRWDLSTGAVLGAQCPRARNAVACEPMQVPSCALAAASHEAFVEFKLDRVQALLLIGRQSMFSACLVEKRGTLNCQFVDALIRLALLEGSVRTHGSAFPLRRGGWPGRSDR